MKQPIFWMSTQVKYLKTLSAVFKEITRNIHFGYFNW